MAESSSERSRPAPLRTHTFTFEVERYANPFLVCDSCGDRVEGHIVAPGRTIDGHNYPCRHLGMDSTCPSWSPVDGCRCVEHLGVAEPCTNPRDGGS